MRSDLILCTGLALANVASSEAAAQTPIVGQSVTHPKMDKPCWLTSINGTESLIGCVSNFGSHAVLANSILDYVTLPPSVTQLGGVFSGSCATGQAAMGISTAGSLICVALPQAGTTATACIACPATLTAGAGISGDLQVAYTAQTETYDRFGPHLDMPFVLTFTPSYTTAAWTALTAYPAAGPTPGTSGWITQAGYVYQSQVSCTSGMATPPTSTTIGATQTTADNCQWKVISVVMSGNFIVRGLPIAAPAGAPMLYPALASTAFVWGSSVTQLQWTQAGGASAMTLAVNKSGSPSSSVPMTSFISGTTYTLNGQVSMRLGVQ